MPLPPRGFGREARLTSRPDFQRVFAQGRKTPGRSFTLWSRLSETGGAPRIGLSVSAKVGSAVRRNRLKRLTRETFRLNRERLRPADIVVSLRPGCPWRGRADAERELLEAFGKAGLLQ